MSLLEKGLIEIQQIRTNISLKRKQVELRMAKKMEPRLLMYFTFLYKNIRSTAPYPMHNKSTLAFFRFAESFGVTAKGVLCLQCCICVILMLLSLCLCFTVRDEGMGQSITSPREYKIWLGLILCSFACLCIINTSSSWFLLQQQIPNSDQNKKVLLDSFSENVRGTHTLPIAYKCIHQLFTSFMRTRSSTGISSSAAVMLTQEATSTAAAVETPNKRRKVGEHHDYSPKEMCVYWIVHGSPWA